MSSISFPFFDLPPEIREKIYIVICSHPSDYTPVDSLWNLPSFPYNLLFLNSQIYQEIRPVFFTCNIFSLTIRGGRRNDTLAYFLSPAFKDNRRQIRCLRIMIKRWGTKDFFLGTLIPILEDCILNGRLRILEVVIKRTFLEALEGNEAMTREEHENWRGLKRVLRDPYMEKVKLLGGTMEDAFWDMEDKVLDDRIVQDVGWLLDEGLTKKEPLEVEGRLC